MQQPLSNNVGGGGDAAHHKTVQELIRFRCLWLVVKVDQSGFSLLLPHLELKMRSEG